MVSLTTRIDNLERNLIINGNMDHWQRSLTVTPSVSLISNQDKFLADRWVLDAWGGGSYAVTYSQSTDVPTLAQSGFQSVYSILATNNSTDGASTFRYTVEGYDYQRIHGKTVRLSFWVKSSVAGVYSVGFENEARNRSYVTTYSIAQANTWEKKAIDVTLDNTGTWNFNNGAGLTLWFVMGQPTNAGTGQTTSLLNQWQGADKRWSNTNVDAWRTTNGATFQMAQVMLIPQDFTIAGASNADIPFRRAALTIQQELAMCQRYFWALTATAGTGTAFAVGGSTNTSTAFWFTRFPVTMRAAATATIPTGVVGSDFRLDGPTLRTCTQVPAFSAIGTDTAYGNAVDSGAGLTAAAAYTLIANTGSNGKIWFEAEI